MENRFYNFELLFQIKNQEKFDYEKYIELIYKQGCDDATVSGNNQSMILSLLFSRYSITQSEAIHSAIEDVMNVGIKNIELIEVKKLDK